MKNNDQLLKNDLYDAMFYDWCWGWVWSDGIPWPIENLEPNIGSA